MFAYCGVGNPYLTAKNHVFASLPTSTKVSWFSDLKFSPLKVETLSRGSEAARYVPSFCNTMQPQVIRPHLS